MNRFLAIGLLLGFGLAALLLSVLARRSSEADATSVAAPPPLPVVREQPPTPPPDQVARPLRRVELGEGLIMMQVDGGR